MELWHLKEFKLSLTPILLFLCVRCLLISYLLLQLYVEFIRREILFKLYKAYILPHFYYCSSVWHFCGARDADKLEALNKRILGDYSSPYNALLSKVNSTSLCNKRVQNFLILLYKNLFFTFFLLI